ncbi:MAG TPA: hypothetical protein VGY32_14525, partial [Solirubrobacteraceae bacterium]|nr:hypothetical protein [Solirubrobacteraceae bacterium]
MGTATSRQRFACAAPLAVLGIGLACAGCGSSNRSSAGARTTSAGAGTAAAWLHASPAPASWPAASIPSGGRMPYPPAWHPIHGDPGTASAALTSPDGKFVGYMNLTPRQSHETLANWPTFRVDHNHDEGDR